MTQPSSIFVAGDIVQAILSAFFCDTLYIYLRFVLKHLPGNIGNKEIEDMINTVDKNKDGKISYSEFRVSGV